MEEIAPQLWSYHLLKEIALHEPPATNFINELKSMFVNDIGSPRRYDCIRTMADLIDCLERRDVLNEQNVEPLRLLGNKQLDEAIDHYVPPNNSPNSEGINQYHEIHMANELASKVSLSNHRVELLNRNVHSDNTRSRSASATTTTTNSFPTANNSYPFALSEQKRAAIYKMLSQHLGTHWRSFGRELGIREGAMDEIELQYPRELSARVYKVMKYFEDDSHDPKMHLRIIKEALERARRKDLRRKIDDIMSH